MTRPYHSVSSAKLGERCERAWAYCYIDGLREHGPTWDEIESGAPCPGRMRSLALGKATHTIGEEYYGAGADIAPRWASLPGQIYASGIAHLPPPARCDVIEIEASLGTISTGLALPKPPTAYDLHGVRWGGFRDLLVRVDDAWLQIDYKTTKDIARWSLSPDRLEADAQLALYTAEACDSHDLRELASRWLYLETGRVRRSRPVDVTMSRDRAAEIMLPFADLARHLDTIPSSSEAVCNTRACYDYGGCQYHHRNGGPCDAKVDLMAYYRQERSATMPMPADLKAKFAAIAPPPPPPPVAPATVEAPAPVEMTASAPVEAPVEAPAKKTRARKIKNAPASAPTEALPPGRIQESGAHMVALANAVAVAEASLVTAQDAYAVALDALRDAVGS